jgi:acetyl-CoA carboxylase carboxyltransferase component
MPAKIDVPRIGALHDPSLRASANGAVEFLYRPELGDEGKIKKRIDEHQKRFANPFVVAERGYIDEVIMPHSTRRRVARALQLLRNKHVDCQKGTDMPKGTCLRGD